MSDLAQFASLMLRLSIVVTSVWWSVPTAVAASRDGQLRVVTVGTSLTLRGDWQGDLADKLNTCLDRGATVEIVAKAGANSTWGLEVIPQVALAMPDVAVLEFAVNDADLWDGVSLVESRSNLVAMVAELRSANPAIRIILPSMNPVFGWRAWTRPWLASYVQVLADFAEPAVTFVEMGGLWNALSQAELDGGIPDGLHPKPELARAIIVPALAEAIGGVDCITR